jgi:hypothetical protein
MLPDDAGDRRLARRVVGQAVVVAPARLDQPGLVAGIGGRWRGDAHAEVARLASKMLQVRLEVLAQLRRPILADRRDADQDGLYVFHLHSTLNLPESAAC